MPLGSKFKGTEKGQQTWPLEIDFEGQKQEFPFLNFWSSTKKDFSIINVWDNYGAKGQEMGTYLKGACFFADLSTLTKYSWEDFFSVLTSLHKIIVFSTLGLNVWKIARFTELEFSKGNSLKLELFFSSKFQYFQEARSSTNVYLLKLSTTTSSFINNDVRGFYLQPTRTFFHKL